MFHKHEGRWKYTTPATLLFISRVATLDNRWAKINYVFQTDEKKCIETYILHLEN